MFIPLDRKKPHFRKTTAFFALLCFLAHSFGSIPGASAQPLLGLPEPGVMVGLSPAYQPAVVRGLTVHQDNPFLFDFIVDRGQENLEGEALKSEGQKLIAYFLASLAVPETDLWVNLSPYEQGRIVPEALGSTAMGRDLLAQDYLLKQITASLLYPEHGLGRKFWEDVYAQARRIHGTTHIPVNTFNKVWIVADKAEIFERGQTAFVTGMHLKVMLEEDYLALKNHVILNEVKDLLKDSQRQGSSFRDPSPAAQDDARKIIRQLILPALEKEINEGKNFAVLRQISNSLLLAAWYKKNLKAALLNRVYAGRGNVNGIDLEEKDIKQKIYARYVQAYKKGAFNFIREEPGQGASATPVPRRYFSGGWELGEAIKNFSITTDTAQLSSLSGRPLVDMAMTAEIDKQNLTSPGRYGEARGEALAEAESTMEEASAERKRGPGRPRLTDTRENTSPADRDFLDAWLRAGLIDNLATEQEQVTWLFRLLNVSDRVIRRFEVDVRAEMQFFHSRDLPSGTVRERGAALRALIKLAKRMRPLKDLGSQTVGIERGEHRAMKRDMVRLLRTLLQYKQDRNVVDIDQDLGPALMVLQEYARKTGEAATFRLEQQSPPKADGPIQVSFPGEDRVGLVLALRAVLSSAWDRPMAADAADQAMTAKATDDEQVIARIIQALQNKERPLVKLQHPDAGEDEPIRPRDFELFLRGQANYGDMMARYVPVEGSAANDMRPLILQLIWLAAKYNQDNISELEGAFIIANRATRDLPGAGEDAEYIFISRLADELDVSIETADAMLADFQGQVNRAWIGRAMYGLLRTIKDAPRWLLRGVNGRASGFNVSRQKRLTDAAMTAVTAPTRGGIDLNTVNTQWTTKTQGEGVHMQVDEALIARIEREGIGRLVPRLRSITPITSLEPFLDHSI